MNSAELSFMKIALLEELVRVGLKDIPKTPRLLMRHRTPEERAMMGKLVRQGYEKAVTNPIMRQAEKHVLSRVPEGKARTVARKGVQLIARDPIGQLAANMVPVPGASPAYEVGKAGLTRLINKLDPVPLGLARA